VLQADWSGAGLVLGREERLGAEAVVVRVGEEAARAVAEELLRQVDGVAARPVGVAAAEAARVEAGLARFGPDFGPERFPQEVGETGALDFEKGCYLGQEVVARIHYRGKVNHRLCGLRLGGEELPAPGTAVVLDGDEVGQSGTAVRSLALGTGIGLAVLHRKAEIGAAVAVGGSTAEIVDLPFAAS
jgi:folate-binding protein YgfZ